MSFWKDGEILYSTSGWKNGKYIYTNYVNENGVLRAKEYEHSRFDSIEKDRFCEWLNKFGYDYRAFGDDFVKKSVLGPFVNLPMKDAEDNIKRLAERLHERRRKEKAVMEIWNQLDSEFRGFVVGIDKWVDVYDSGFSVRVLLSTQYSFSERRKFVKERSKDIVKWTMAQISENKNMLNRIGDLKFYKPVEIITLRNPEVELKFQVKNVAVFVEEE